MLLRRDFIALQREPIEVSVLKRRNTSTYLSQGISAVPQEDKGIYQWNAKITGMAGTEWEGKPYIYAYVLCVCGGGYLQLWLQHAHPLTVLYSSWPAALCGPCKIVTSWAWPDYRVWSGSRATP